MPGSEQSHAEDGSGALREESWGWLWWLRLQEHSQGIAASRKVWTKKMCVRDAMRRQRMSSTASGSALLVFGSDVECVRRSPVLVKLAIEGRQKHEAFWTRGFISPKLAADSATNARTVHGCERALESVWTTRIWWPTHVQCGTPPMWLGGRCDA